MAGYTGTVLTVQGRNLQAKAQIGTPLEFTKVKIGNGTLTAGTQLENLTDLISPKMTLSIQDAKVVGDGTSRLRVILTNQGLTSGFAVTEIGLFAKDPQAGEILYSIVNAGDQADYLPAQGGSVIVDQTLDLITVIGNAANVTAQIDGRITIATKEDIKNAVDNHNNDPNAHELMRALHLWQSKKSYGIGEICYGINAPSWSYFLCSQAGVTGDAEPVWGATPGSVITDGTAKWVVKDIRDIDASKYAPAGYGVGTVAADISGKDLNTIYLCGLYRGIGCINAPNGSNGWFYYQVISYDTTHAIQVSWEMYSATNGQTGRMYTRRLADSTMWEAWRQIPTMGDVAPAGLGTGGSVAANITDVFTINDSGKYYIGDSCLNIPIKAYGWLDVYIFGQREKLLRFSAVNGANYYINQITGVWGTWTQMPSTDMVAPAGYGLGTTAANISNKDLNSIYKSGWYVGASCTHAPNDSSSWFYYQITSLDSTHVIQEAWEMYQNANGQYGRKYMRSLVDTTWSSWMQIATTNTQQQIAVLTGTVADGGTIPLPPGYSQEQCKWYVSPYYVSGRWDTTVSIACTADSNRKVTVNSQADGRYVSGIANYWIQGVK